MTQITINSTDSKKSMSKNYLQRVVCGNFFEQFVDAQRISPSKSNGLSPESVAIFRSETTDILCHCNPHDAVQNQETTHLVVGYVQSGKTMSFTGLTALALDNGYRVIIYLAGTKNNLLAQTSKRLKKDLIGGKNKNNNFYKIHPNPTSNDIEDIVGHIESSDRPIVLIPILKHYTHIDKLIQVVNSAEYKSVMKNETVIIIDDEADQASLNNYGRINSQEERNKDEEEKSSTYDAILRLRASLPGNTYIQYTATPQANILISMQDLLSPKSHTLLTPGEGYIGGKLFFGKGPNHELFNGGLIIQIPDTEVFHKTRNPLDRIPKSLKDALIFHILAVAIVVKWQAPDDITYLSMMVHPDNEKKWNRKFKVWIDHELKNWRKALKMPDGCDDKVDLLDYFKRIFPKAVEFYAPSDRPTFEQIEPYIAEVINDKKVYLVNTDKDAQTEIEWDNYKMHILVGAEMLNRGFTVEKLATTYMPRYTTGITNADTIQQRCRFFGYKKDYIRSCRVFLPATTIANYHSYVDHEEELRLLLKNCDSLASVERSILLSPSLRPTRRNVLPVWVVNDKLKGMFAMQAFASRYTIEHNDKLVKSFLDKHEKDFIVRPDTTKDRTHRWFKLDVDEAIEFLSDFNFKNWPDAQRKANSIRYLRYLSSEENDNPLKFVYFYQMAYEAGPRHRSFDQERCRLAKNTDLFAGPSSVHDSTNYPGDRKIYGSEDTITIQLHHIEFDGAALDFPRTAYTLAMYYPKSLATNYCQNIENESDE
jgi:hypothetical protein